MITFINNYFHNKVTSNWFFLKRGLTDDSLIVKVMVIAASTFGLWKFISPVSLFGRLFTLMGGAIFGRIALIFSRALRISNQHALPSGQKVLQNEKITPPNFLPSNKCSQSLKSDIGKLNLAEEDEILIEDQPKTLNQSENKQIPHNKEENLNVREDQQDSSYDAEHSSQLIVHKNKVRSRNFQSYGQSPLLFVQDRPLFNQDLSNPKLPFDFKNHALNVTPFENQFDIEEGKRLTYDYADKGFIYGKEIIERKNVIDELNILLHAQIKMFETCSNEKSLANSSEFDKIQSQILLCKASLNRAKRVKKEFIKSGYFREELTKIVNQGQNYAQKVNLLCVEGLVNYRYHQCVTSSRTIAFFRLGVMSDPRNGFTHLGELKELVKDKEKLDNKIESLSSKFRQLIKKGKKNFAKIAAYEYALAQLEEKNIEETILERTHLLNCQMLLLVQAQIEKNLTSITADSSFNTFHLSHVALMNPTRYKIDYLTGWVQHEENKMADMFEIFKEFSGKTLIFDGLGPCLDDKGNVHLSQILLDASGNHKQIKLETHYMNISVQGYNKNDGLQKEINQSAIVKLLKTAFQKNKDFPDHKEFLEGLNLLFKVQRSLNQGDSDYQIAEDLSIALLKLEIPLSLSCLSAKDRTGFVAARIAFQFVSEDMIHHSDLKNNDPKLRKLRSKFSKQLLDKEGCAAKVVKDNTNLTVLKCSAFDLPGFNGSIEGRARRLSYYFKQGVVLF